LQAILTLDSKQFKQSFASAEKVVKNVSKRMSRMGKDLSKFVTVPLTGAGVAITKFGMNFEHEMVKIETLVGVNRGTVARWGDDLEKMASHVGRGPSELARALFVVTSAGERTETALTIVEQAAKASAIGLGDTAEVARAATGAMKAFQSQGLGAAEAVDILTATVREGNLQAEDLAGVIGRVNGMAAGLGITFAEVGGAIASYTRLGIKAEEATVGLRAVLSSLVGPTEASEKALLEVGLSTEELLRQVREEGLAGTLNNLIKMFDGNVIAIKKVIPNVRALAFLMGTASANGKEFVDVTKAVGDALGSVDTGFIRVKETAQATFDEMKASLESLAVTLSESGGLLDLFKEVTEKVRHVASVFKELTPETQRLVIQVAALSALLGPLLVLLGWMAPALTAISIAVAALTIKFIALTAAAWPFLLLLAVKNLPQIVKAWDTIQNSIREFREEFEEANRVVEETDLARNPTLRARALGNLYKLGVLIEPEDASKKTNAVTNQFDKNAAIISEALEKLDKEMRDMLAVAELLGDGVDAVDEEMGMLQSTIEGLVAEGISPTNEAVIELADRWNELNDQVKKTEALEGIDELFAELRKELHSLKLDSVTADLYEQQQALLEYAAAAGLSVEEINKLMDQLEYMHDEMASVQKQVDARKSLEQPFLNAAENIQREWGNMFSDLIRNGTSAFDDFGEFVLDLFARLAGEVVTLLVFSPEVLKGGVGGGGGILGGLGGWLSNLFGPAYGSYQQDAPYSVPVPPGGGNIIIGGIDIGQIASAVGNAIPGMLAGFAAGQVFGFGTGAKGEGALGRKIGGFIGTIVGSFVGRWLGQGLGSVVGAVLGNFVLGSLGWGIQNLVETRGKGIITPTMSLAQQSMVAGTLPGFAPALHGDFSTMERIQMVGLDIMTAGVFSRIAALFGLFDPGKSKMQLLSQPADAYDPSRFVYDISEETPFGYIGLDKTYFKHMGDKFTRQFVDLVVEMDEALASLMSDETIASVSEALGVAIHSRQKSRDMSDEIFRAVKEHVAIILNAMSGETLQTQYGEHYNVLLNSLLMEAQSGNDFDVLLDLAAQIIIQWYAVEKAIQDTIDAYTVGIPEAQTAIENLNAAFNELAASAREVGMGSAVLAKIEAGRAEALAALTSEFERDIQLGIWTIVDPFKKAMSELQRVQEERLRNAEVYGADILEVERLNALERAQLLKAATVDITKYLTGLRTPYALPVEQVDSAREQFFALASRVSAGEYVDTAELLSIAQMFQQASRAVYASSPQFFEDLSLIEEVLQAALARFDILAADTDFSNVSSIDSARSQEQALLTGIDDGVQELIESQVALITNLTNEVSSLREAVEEQQAELIRLGRSAA
jgi:TP901 family phage tail tape measure protein